jgi:hypothetical protein
MVHKYKRKTSDKYSKDSLASAIEAVHSGDTIRKATIRFVIPYTTLQNHLCGSYVKERGHLTALSSEEKEFIVQAIEYCAEYG